LCSYFLYGQIAEDVRGSRLLERNFYGTLSTSDAHRKNPDDDVRQLYHGSIKHGEQFLAPARRREATTYYGATSGVGLALANTPAAGKKVGMIGLGAGTLAAYGQAGDTYRLYEINPAVVSLAQTEFSFIADSPAQVELVIGDARLSLEAEPPQAFDVLAVDAFSGDSIPVHLVTAQAMTVYLRHLKPAGIVAFHVTNRFLNLAPVIATIAANQNLHVALIHDDAELPTLRTTDWVLVSRSAATLEQAAIRDRTTAITAIPGLPLWTDDFNNLFEVLK
jgi:spermidine synthase